MPVQLLYSRDGWGGKIKEGREGEGERMKLGEGVRERDCFIPWSNLKVEFLFFMWHFYI
jgi:hypothetical protein